MLWIARVVKIPEPDLRPVHGVVVLPLFQQQWMVTSLLFPLFVLEQRTELIFNYCLLTCCGNSLSLLCDCVFGYLIPAINGWFWAWISHQFCFLLRPRFSLVIRSTDNGSPPMKLEKTFTIVVTDVNEKPTAIQVTKQPRDQIGCIPQIKTQKM